MYLHGVRGREGEGLFASWESSRAMDGLKRRRPDSNLVMDDEVRLSEKALPLAAPVEATDRNQYDRNQYLTGLVGYLIIASIFV